MLSIVYRYPVTIIIAASFIVQGSYLLWYGPVMSLDSLSYSRWAGYLLEYRFNYFLFFENVKFAIPTYFYSGFITIVAFAKVLLAEKWAYGILGLNLVAYAATAGLITRIISSTTSDPISALVGGGLFLLNFESFQWVRYVLTDSTFMFLTVTSYYFVFKYILRQEDEKRNMYVILAIICCLALMSYRPTAAPIVLVLIATIVLFVTNPKGIQSAWVNKTTISILILIIGLAILIQAYYMQHIDRWPVSFARRYLELIATHYAEGRIIDDRPELNLSQPTVYTNYIIIILTRMYYFFVFAIDAFSARHVIYNLLTFPPIYLLGLLFWVGEIIRPDVRMDQKIRVVGLTSTILIVLIVLFNSLLMIDYDWRYRAPAIPFMVILASLGVRNSLSWLQAKMGVGR